LSKFKIFKASSAVIGFVTRFVACNVLSKYSWKGFFGAADDYCCAFPFFTFWKALKALLPNEAAAVIITLAINPLTIESIIN
jgi:hypothetical protein